MKPIEHFIFLFIYKVNLTAPYDKLNQNNRIIMKRFIWFSSNFQIHYSQFLYKTDEIYAPTLMLFNFAGFRIHQSHVKITGGNFSTFKESSKKSTKHLIPSPQRQREKRQKPRKKFEISFVNTCNNGSNSLSGNYLLRCLNFAVLETVLIREVF